MSPLPIHPRTGLRAIGVINGRPVWPIAGGAPTQLEVLEQKLERLEGDKAAFEEEFRASGRSKMLASEQRDWDQIVRAEAQARGAIARAQDADRRRGVAARAADELSRGAATTGEPAFGRGADTVYARGNGNSYFADLINVRLSGDFEAQQRLNEHGAMIERVGTDLPEMFRSTRERGGAHMELRVNPNRTDGQGGFFVPPLWLVDEFVGLLRAGRALAARCRQTPLPPGTDSVNLPKVLTGTTTAVQTADAAGVSSTDITDTSVSSGVKTIAGQQDVALQLIEQSPGNFDEVIFEDLAADYNQKLDLQVIAGTAASGQVRGILNVSGLNAITYTDATPTLPEMWVPIMQSLSQIAKLRFRPADTVGMHPSLWYWAMSQLDTANRPLISGDNDGLNTLAVYDAAGAEGVVGAIGHVPVVVDANVPTNLGAGTNETRIISGRYNDAWLYEGAVRTRALFEVLSGTLQVRLQLYNYFALIPDRYAVAYSVISGTGMIPAAGF